jgi:hypothetical protein
MSTDDMIATAIHRKTMHGGWPAAMRAMERDAGRTLVEVGSYWLPEADWHEDCVVSLDGNRMRLVLLNAHRPGGGAFMRLVKHLIAHGFTPVAVEPNDRIEASLIKRGWRSRVVGRGAKRELIYYPRGRR